MRFIALFSMLLLALPTLAQEVPVDTLHVTSRLVEISAAVTDKRGEPRIGLTKDDFTLKQDGKDQPIQYFSQGDELPLTFIVMIDTSGSQRSFIHDEQQACDVFFQTVLGRPQDYAALVEVNAHVTARSMLTNDPKKLHTALADLHYNDKDSAETHIYDAIWTLSKDILSKVHGRKAIVLISDGGALGNTVEQVDAIAEAQHENVPVYAVSYSAWSDLNVVSAAPAQQATYGVMSSGGAGGSSDVRIVSSPNDPGMAALKLIASSTGGHVYQVSRSTPLNSIFETIADQLRKQYEIGYTLPPDTKLKQLHKLELKTKDKSLRVQARTGFYAYP